MLNTLFEKLNLQIDDSDIRITTRGYDGAMTPNVVVKPFQIFNPKSGRVATVDVAIMPPQLNANLPEYPLRIGLDTIDILGIDLQEHNAQFSALQSSYENLLNDIIISDVGEHSNEKSELHRKHSAKID